LFALAWQPDVSHAPALSEPWDQVAGPEEILATEPRQSIIGTQLAASAGAINRSAPEIPA